MSIKDVLASEREASVSIAMGKLHLMIKIHSKGPPVSFKTRPKLVMESRSRLTTRLASFQTLC